MTPGGVPVYARLDNGVRAAFLSAGAWAAEELAWSGPGPNEESLLYGVDDLAVAQGGRVVLSVAVDPGPGPTTTSSWPAPRPAGHGPRRRPSHPSTARPS